MTACCTFLSVLSCSGLVTRKKLTRGCEWPPEPSRRFVHVRRGRFPVLGIFVFCLSIRSCKLMDGPGFMGSFGMTMMGLVVPEPSQWHHARRSRSGRKRNPR